jgi:hypothetical protein
MLAYAHLQNEQTEKVEVGQPLELLEQVEWDEGEKRVLRCLDVIVLQANMSHTLTTHLRTMWLQMST